ncbi:MAG: hypothetical protein SFU55_09700 [Methylophilus sp.]|nr:hypothetical protein [Methylophilus sp.]
MTLSINLAPLDLASLPTAETNPKKITAFINSLAHADTFQSASRLLDVLKTFNRQKFNSSVRIDTLELYRKITAELAHDLEEVYATAPVPLSDEAKSYAALAEALWLETGYGYKRALVDLKHKLFNLQSDKQHSLVILRIIEALKNEALVNYLTYTPPSDSLWSDLHKVYYHALQLSLENVEIHEQSVASGKTITLLYSQVLLMHLANPQRLHKSNIKIISNYIPSLAKYAELRGMGYVENPVGAFLIELDSKKPPVPYLKNKNKPNIETDILLLTIEVARQVHQQLRYIQQNKITPNNPLPTSALEIVDEALLMHLIKYFGISSSRLFTRVAKKNSVSVAVGLEAASILFRSAQRANDDICTQWEMINASPNGYALETAETHHVSVNVGDLVTVQESPTSHCVIGHIVWIINKDDLIQIGIKLIAPSAETVAIKTKDKIELEYALLIPEIKLLKQPASIITKHNSVGENVSIEVKCTSKKFTLQTGKLIEGSTNFDRLEYRLIDDDLS